MPRSSARPCAGCRSASRTSRICGPISTYRCAPCSAEGSPAFACLSGGPDRAVSGWPGDQQFGEAWGCSPKGDDPCRSRRRPRRPMPPSSVGAPVAPACRRWSRRRCGGRGGQIAVHFWRSAAMPCGRCVRSRYDRIASCSDGSAAATYWSMFRAQRPGPALTISPPKAAIPACLFAVGEWIAAEEEIDHRCARLRHPSRDVHHRQPGFSAAILEAVKPPNE